MQRPSRTDTPLSREFRQFLRSERDSAQHHRVPTRARGAGRGGLMAGQAHLGVEVAQLVARDLRIAEPAHTTGDRLTITRTEAGRYWELLVVRRGVPTVRIIAGLRRSPTPPWRTDKLTYVTTEPTPEQTASAAPLSHLDADAQAAWALVKAARVINDVACLIRRLSPQLASLAPAQVLVPNARIDRDTYAEFVAGTFALEDLVNELDALQLDRLTLPDSDIGVDLDAIEQRAAADLAAGSSDPRKVMFAASVTSTAHGFPALANGIDMDSVGSWGDLRVGELLETFRGAASQVHEVYAAARIGPDARWRHLDVHQLTRLSRALNGFRR